MAGKEDVTAEAIKSCIYCLADGEEMTDPKLAPCGHIFCLGCLKDAVMAQNDKTTLKCPLCERKHDLVSLGGVESFPVPSGDVQIPVTPKPIPEDVCQICKIDGTVRLAISFCRECNGLLCCEHQKQHDKFQSGLFSTKHEIIPVAEYSKAKAKFFLRMCSSHPKNEMDGMCIKCKEPNCSTCRSFVDDFNCKSGEKHRSKPIQELAADVKVKVTGAVAEIVTLIGNLQELVELSERKGADNEVELDDLITSMDCIVNEQVEEIRRKYEEMKGKVVVLREENLERKRKYQGDLQEQVKGLQHLVDNISLSLETKHQIDVIQEGEALCDQLAIERDVKTNPLELVSLTLIPTDKCRGIELKLVDLNALPVNLVAERVHSMSNGSGCRSVCATSGGALVAGGATVFDMRGDMLGEQITPVALSGNSVGCAVKGEQIFVRLGPSSQVASFNIKGQHIGSWPVVSDTYASNLVVVAENILVPVSSQRRVDVYNIEGSLLKTINHPSFSGQYLHVAATSHDTFITVDYATRFVTKFNMQSGEVVWQSTGPANPMGPAVDAAGRIWVPSNNGQTVHVLSSEGAFIKEFAVPGATQVWGSVVRSDQLVLASDRGLHIYTMTY